MCKEFAESHVQGHADLDGFDHPVCHGTKHPATPIEIDYTHHVGGVRGVSNVIQGIGKERSAFVSEPHTDRVIFALAFRADSLRGELHCAAVVTFITVKP